MSGKLFSRVFVGGSLVVLISSAWFENLYADSRVGGIVDVAVKNKLFPKKGRIELNGPNVGSILNQSYIQTFTLHGGLTYFTSEEWGFGVEGLFAFNQNKPERDCLDYFLNDPDFKIGEVECTPEGPNRSVFPNPESGWANYGPAYVPIRELQMMLAVTATWNPVYAKQLLFLSATSYFDLFMTFGLGLAMSEFYPKQLTLKNGAEARGPTPDKDDRVRGTPGVDQNVPGVWIDDDPNGENYGPNGRNPPLQEQHPMITLGIGQKFHFFHRFNIKIELRNYTLIGTDSGFDTFFALWGGLGIRF